MNFQQVVAGNGQLVTMGGVLSEIGPQKVSKNNKPYCSCKIQDELGEVHNATINGGKDGVPQATLLGKNCIFALSTYQGQTGVAYSGFCNGLAHAQSNAPLPVIQNQSPRPVPQAQQTYHPVQPAYVPPVTNAIPNPPAIARPVPQSTGNVSIERQCSVKAAVELLKGKTDSTKEEVILAASAFAHFIKTGEFAMGNEDNILDTPAEYDDLPQSFQD